METLFGSKIKQWPTFRVQDVQRSEKLAHSERQPATHWTHDYITFV